MTTRNNAWTECSTRSALYILKDRTHLSSTSWLIHSLERLGLSGQLIWVKEKGSRRLLHRNYDPLWLLCSCRLQMRRFRVVSNVDLESCLKNTTIMWVYDFLSLTGSDVTLPFLFTQFISTNSRYSPNNPRFLTADVRLPVLKKPKEPIR